jgi:hypothetical protein
MAAVVYLLCGFTCAMCAYFLTKAYQRQPTPLLLWSSTCFLFFTLNNIVLFVDTQIVGPNIDLSVLRAGTAVIGSGLLAFGLISEGA